ncbi:hypothetical protein LVD17_15005 [Fulvivirga ulvae]|uniref:hypothetical protein n=1 Tax=Fulvivirga ulvae TaxID=2904245 RepID=UPI001F382655|nr:hypothetical protein [Fulvivirga ulvae]UII29608.1 hypothetical protein LVD17_15005 [Fulvivirga ulvae]
MTDKASVSTYLKNDYFVIQYDHTNDVLIPGWGLAPTPDEFKNSMREVISALKHFRATKVVWDTTLLGALLYEVQEWIATDWLREAIESGYTYAAFVVPEEVFTKMSVEETVEMGTANTAGIRKTKYFDNMKNAMEWVCGQQET